MEGNSGTAMGQLDSARARELSRKSGEARRRKAAERKATQRRRRRAERLHREGADIITAMDLWPEFNASSWDSWRAFLRALFGLAMSQAELATFVRHTGRTVPRRAFSECWAIVGRRGGKSRIAALVASYLALFKDYSTILAPGERGTVMVLASDRRQARQVFGYVRGFIHSVPMLSDLLEVERKDSIDLKNGVSIEVHTASYRAVRGYTVLAAVCDETAFWRDESSSLDSILVNISS